MKDRDIREILRIALPGAISFVLSNLVNFIGTVIIGRVKEKSAPEITAVGISLMIFFVVSSFATALGSGVQSYVSRYKGSGEEEKMLSHIIAGLLGSIFLGLITNLIFFLFAPFILEISTRDNIVVEKGETFLKIKSLGIIPLFATMILRGFFDGIGEPREHLKFNISSTILGIILLYPFIFGFSFIPRMEVTGFGIASTLSAFFSLLHGMWLLRKYIKVRKVSLEEILETTIKDLKISLPASITNFISSLSFLYFLWTTKFSGTEHQAATFIIVNIISIFFIPAISFGIAIASVVGREIPKDENNAKKAFSKGIKLSLIISFPFSIAMILLPESVMEIFTRDKIVIEYGKNAVRIIGLSTPSIFLSAVLLKALMNLGDTRFLMLSIGGIFLFIFLPLIFIIHYFFKLGVVGNFTIASVFFLIFSIMLIIRYKKENWMKL